MKHVYIYLKDGTSFYDINNEDIKYVEDYNLVIFKRIDEFNYEKNWVVLINYKTRIKENIPLEDIEKIVIHLNDLLEEIE